jgi:DNA-binding FadR family transcriptional regulator
VREAIIALELDGLMEVRKGSGVYVSALVPRGAQADDTDIGPFELIEARRLIESECCALAAARVSEDELQILSKLVTAIQAENARAVIMSENANRRFHLEFARAAQNSAMYAAVKILWDGRSLAAISSAH